VGRAQERRFSGPQVGERLLPFKTRGFYPPDAGKELDFVKQAAGKPIVLVFIHEVNRPSLLLTRTLTVYTATRAKEGLATGIVWLADDVTEAEIALKRIVYLGNGLAQEAPLGISLDGQEGPGSYGLNRTVSLTILVGKDDKITANFTLVQPSIQVDLPKILLEVAKVAGGPVADLQDVMVMERVGHQLESVKAPMRRVIEKTAKPDEVDKAAASLEQLVQQDQLARNEVGRIARALIKGGRLADYATPRAQEYLHKWAAVYGEGPAKNNP
jgi:hypothetical protein